jgi:hypothetical protein
MWKKKTQTQDFEKRLAALEKQVAYISEFCQAVKLNETGFIGMFKHLKLDLDKASAIVDHKNVHVEIPTTFYHDFIKYGEAKKETK